MKNTEIFKIRVENEQTSEDMSDSICESGSGTYRIKDGMAYISYTAAGTKVFIKADKSCVWVKRMGENKSEISYRPGEQLRFEYNTAYGVLDMQLYTEHISCCLNDDGGTIGLRYILKTGGDKLYNNMKIYIGR